MKVIRTKIGEGGRIIIPALIRQNLDLAVGDDVVIHVEDEKIYITTPNQSLRKLQEALKSCSNDHKFSLVDDLIAQRRLEGKDD